MAAWKDAKRMKDMKLPILNVIIEDRISRGIQRFYNIFVSRLKLSLCSVASTLDGFGRARRLTLQMFLTDWLGYRESALRLRDSDEWSHMVQA